MIDSERNWRSEYGENTRQTFTKSLSLLDDVTNVTSIFVNCYQVPTIYGKKNSNYVSPTFKSSGVFYGEENIRSHPETHFYTVNEASLGSARSFSQNRIEQYNQQCQSTNQFAPIQNKFHKSIFNPNLKNFSQVQIGYNHNVEEFYKKQFDQKRAVAELKFGKLDSSEKPTFQGSTKNQKSLNKQNFKQEYKEPQYYSPRNHNQNRVISPFKERPNLRIDVNQDKHLAEWQQEYGYGTQKQRNLSEYDFPVQKERLLSPQPRKQEKILEYEVKSDCGQSPREQNFQPLYKSPRSQIDEQEQAYEPPDWGFFSPQSDPFKLAFERKSRERVRSVERVHEEKRFAFEDERNNLKKRILQNSKFSGKGDCFVQTIQGDTLKFSHDFKENLRDERRRMISPCFSQSQLNERKQVLQNNRFGEGGLYSFLGERNEREIQQQRINNKEYQKAQIVEILSRRHQVQYQRLEEEKAILNDAYQKAKQNLEFTNFKKHHIQQDLIKSYDEGQDKKNFMKYADLQEKGSDRIKIDSAYQRGLEKQRQAEIMKKEIQLQLCRSYQEQMYSKHENKVRNMQPLNQKIQFVGSNHQNLGQLSRSNLIGFEKQNSKLQDYYNMKCNSNASTISSYSQQQITRANISQKEFELRKQQMQQSRQMGKYGKANKTVKFQIQSKQVENNGMQMKRQ